MIVATVDNLLVWAVWILAAFACLGSGVAVVSFSNPFYSALALIGNLGSLAVLYLLLSAEFVAAAQVLVYAGAVMVMFLFVIAYLGGRADAPWAGGPPLVRTAAVVVAAILVILLATALLQDSLVYNGRANRIHVDVPRIDATANVRRHRVPVFSGNHRLKNLFLLIDCRLLSGRCRAAALEELPLLLEHELGS